MRYPSQVILGQVLHLADGTLHATREGIPRPAPAGSSPLSDRIGPKPPFSRSTAKTRRAERPVAAFSSAEWCLPTPTAGIDGERAPQPVRAHVSGASLSPDSPGGGGCLFATCATSALSLASGGAIQTDLMLDGAVG